MSWWQLVAIFDKGKRLCIALHTAHDYIERPEEMLVLLLLPDSYTTVTGFPL